MRTIKFNSRILTAISLAFIISVAVTAQPRQGQGQRQGMRMQPALSAEQKTQIADLRTATMQSVLPMKAELKVLSAELNQLSVAAKVDQGAIGAKIDEIANVRAGIAKEKSKHRQAVRALLTPEQRVIFDAKKGKRGMKHNYKKGKCAMNQSNGKKPYKKG